MVKPKRKSHTWFTRCALAALFIPLSFVGNVHAGENRDGGAAERYRSKALRLVKAKRYEKALSWFEKVLPYENQDSDLYFNMVSLAEATKRWDKMLLYSQAFLFLESSSPDTKDIMKSRKKAMASLAKGGLPAAEMTVSLAPHGTDIYVNNVPVMSSGSIPLILPSGTYQLHANKNGYEPWSREITLHPGAAEHVKGSLDKIIYIGFLSVKTTPESGVRVLVDGELKGVTPLDKPIPLETRRFLIRFEKDGYDEWVRYVDIKRDKTHLLTPTMEVKRTPAPKTP